METTINLYCWRRFLAALSFISANTCSSSSEEQFLNLTPSKRIRSLLIGSRRSSLNLGFWEYNNDLLCSCKLLGPRSTDMPCDFRKTFIFNELKVRKLFVLKPIEVFMHNNWLSRFRMKTAQYLADFKIFRRHGTEKSR